MPIDFHLGPSEAAVRAAAAAFAQGVLLPSRAEYLRHADQSQRFQATRPAYAAATAGGLVKGMVAPPLGGAGGSLVESAILVEECYAVEASASLTIFATGLGLTPLNLAAATGGPEEAERLRPFVEPFVKTGNGSTTDGGKAEAAAAAAPLASLVFSEPAGVANWLERGAPGLQTTAVLEGAHWTLTGEKKWATNSAGWDFKGADLSCVVCRDATASSRAADPADDILLLLVRRSDLDASGPDAFATLQHVRTMGHTSASGPHVRYTNVQVPAGQVLARGRRAVDLVTGSFDCSAVLVGAMSVGLMRAAFDAALAFARSDDRAGAAPLLQRQAVADLLSGIKASAEAARALAWKGAHALENGPGEYAARRELANLAKVFASDAAVRAVTDAVAAVGVSAYGEDMPFARLLNDAAVLPIFDGGNVGIRRRNLQALMLDPRYDAWAATYGPSEE